MDISEIKIDKGIPMPPAIYGIGHRSPVGTFLKSLEIGDSFEVSEKDKDAIVTVAYGIRKKEKSEFKLATRKLVSAGTFRVWRIK